MFNRKKQVINIAPLYDEAAVEDNSQNRYIYLEGVQRATIDNRKLRMLADVWAKKPVEPCDQVTLVNDEYVRCVKDKNSKGLHLAVSSKGLAIQWGDKKDGPHRDLTTKPV